MMRLNSSRFSNTYKAAIKSVTIAFCCVSGVATPAAGTDLMENVIVKVIADPGVEYAGFCALSRGQKRIDITGNGAKTFKLEGSAVRCEIEIKGGDLPLTLEIHGPTGNRSKSSTQGLGSKISLTSS